MAQSVLLFSFPAQSQQARNTASITQEQDFLTPIDVTKVVYSGTAYASTDGYSSFYNKAWSVSIEIYSNGAWVAVDSCGGSSSGPGSQGCTVGNTKEGTPVIYPNVTKARWTATAHAYSDHDQLVQVSLSTYQLYVLSISDTGYII
jgi:hypothetical protein